MNTVRSWQPVLDGGDARRARAIVDDIATALAPESGCWQAAGAALTDGLPGGALLFAQLGRTHEARVLLDMAVARSEDIASEPALFGGITGLGWCLRQLAHIARPADLAAVDAIEAELARSLAGAAGPAEFDLMSGLTGLGVFALARPDAASCGTLAELLRWLVAAAEPAPGGGPVDAACAWRTRPSALHAASLAEFPRGCHFPGVAHGTAGVVGLLASAALRGIADAAAQRALVGAMAWLCDRVQPGGHGCFPHQCDPDEPNMQRPPARAAWCTGGPGIAAMFTRAGIATNTAAWREAGTALGLATMQRPTMDTGVRDACLCHGSAGLMLVHARMFAMTGNDAFRREAARWFRHTLALRTPGEGIAGFAAVNTPQQRREAAPGLLFGTAGIALALLACCTSDAPQWDQVLLLS